MKTWVYILCSAGILLLASFAPPVKQRKITLPLENHVGHIQWVKITHYSAIKDSTGSIVKGKLCVGNDFPYIESWTYDKYGDEIENDKYHGLFGNLESKTTHEYYPNGDVKEIIKDTTVQVETGRTEHTRAPDGREHYAGWGTYYTYTYANVNNETLTKYKYVYDPLGKMLEEYTYNNDTVHPNASTLFAYNKMGQLMEADELRLTSVPGYYDNLAPAEKTIFNRDKEGGVIDAITYRSPNSLISHEEKTIFDGAVITTVKTDYSGPKNYMIKTVMKQFIKTHILEEDIYDVHGMLTDYTISRFDAVGQLLDKRKFHINYNNSGRGDTILIDHIINDGHCNVIEDDRYNNEGKIESNITYQYKYDRVGNWVQQFFILDGRTDVITEREIHYFTPNR